MLICFGIDHFLYAEFVASLVPAWIPGHMMWTYFAGAALVGSGLGLLIHSKAITLLLATMLLLWVILLHIPRAVVSNSADKGNEVTSVFEALGFCGIALIIAGMQVKDTVKARNPVSLEAAA